jgi:hypothetical protein
MQNLANLLRSMCANFKVWFDKPLPEEAPFTSKEEEEEWQEYDRLQW